MEAVAISEWLLMEGLVADGQLTSKAAGAELAHLVPPTMKRRIQVLVDELPTLPLMLVRFASIMGHYFYAEDLSMVAKVFKDDKGLLMENLATLREWHLIQPVMEDQPITRNSDATMGKWKVMPGASDSSVRVILSCSLLLCFMHPIDAGHGKHPVPVLQPHVPGHRAKRHDFPAQAQRAQESIRGLRSKA